MFLFIVMDSNIQIIEKPDWVSWDAIHEVIWQAHDNNRKRGISLKHAAYSGEEIKDYLSPDGKMFVALCDGKLIGTAAYKKKTASFWFGESVFAYCCFAAVLPQHLGKGVYGQLVKARELSALSEGIDKMLFNTHPDNREVIQISQHHGYKKVNYLGSRNAPWVFLVKWLNGCPYSNFRIGFMYAKTNVIMKTKYTVKKLLKRGEN